MTEVRVDQGGLYGLAEVTPELRVAQAGTSALAGVTPEVRVAQSGMFVLVGITAVTPVAQAGMYVLASSSPCGTRLAQVWTITRTDGVVFRFTSLDHDWTYNGIEYKACDSLVPSASEAVSEVDTSGTMDLSGALGENGITASALYAGLFDGARVEAWLVPWQGFAVPKLLISGTFGAAEQADGTFKVELQGDGAKLMQTPLVRTLQPGCRWQFGDSRCGKDLGPLTVTGTVDSAIGQRSFVDAARGETAGYFTSGRVTFTTGNNAGVSAEIKAHSAGGSFSLWPRLPFPIAVGDQYSMTPGCTYLIETVGGTNGCTDWGRLVSYGGFNDVPTKDKLTAAAVVKE